MGPTTTLELTGPQFKPLSEALRVTLKLSQFDKFLKERLDINREDIALGDDYQEIVHKVIGEANRAGWVYRLVDGARKERPGNAVFVEYARLLGIGPRGLPDQAQLESIIKKTNTLFDIAVFRQHIGEIEGCVCRVDLHDDGLGTGFLIGPSAVMTNYHVVESVVKKEHELQDFTCRFDFKVREDGNQVNKGTVVKVTDLIAYSPYDSEDLKKGSGLPSPENLDYAMLKLDGEVGKEPIGGKTSGDPRGWVSMRQVTHSFAPKSPLFIVQHPDRKPMKLALDTEAVIGLNGNSTRVEYTTNTEPGSSGSPCFNQDWELVGLHHSGDPNWVPTWNEGIPIVLILNDLKRKGVEQNLG
jgi:V8-like Glu-specific endopeptidase